MNIKKAKKLRKQYRKALELQAENGYKKALFTTAKQRDWFLVAMIFEGGLIGALVGLVVIVL